ncbi:putative Histidine kinase [uncultured Desulfobacterium sp.]|uniref:histidine kinase n=1 Tax=uncultured Desulfobacterium sp. TaxID=201089 RepID=A0A445MW38_9BACT|nr:putative Histidine kinase [uncultured Desulfobacterium sp.]
MEFILEDFLQHNRSKIIEEWVRRQREEISEKYGMRPVEELLETTGEAFDVCLNALVEGKLSHISRFTEKMALKRLEEGFLLSELQKASELYRSIVVSLLAKEPTITTVAEFFNNVNKINGCMAYAGQSFSQHYQDLYQKKALEHNQMIKEAGLRFRTVADFTYDWEYWLSQDNQIRYISPSVERITGYKPEDFMENEALLRELVIPEDREQWDKHCRDSLNRQEPEVAQFRIKRRDGEICWIEHACTQVRDREQRPIGLRVSNRDINYRKRTEEELRNAKERIEAHIANSPLAIIEFDPSYRVIRWSGAAERIFGWQQNEIIGKNISDMHWVHEEDMESVVKLSNDMLAGRIKRILNVNRNYRKDGSIIICEWYNSALHDAQGQMTSVLSQVLDVTEREHAQEELTEYAEKIKFFAYSVAHDIKNPAMGIKLLIKTLLQKYSEVLNEKGKMYCNLIMEASDNITTLAERINIYILTEQTPLVIEDINLNHLFDMLRDEFSAKLLSRKIAWSQPEKKLNIYGDRLSIMRVIRNFLDNSLKYGEDKLSAIEVGYDESDEFHILFVRDDGVGIGRKDSRKIFYPFFRSSTSQGIQGLGLGLAIAHEIAKQHNGKAWAEPGSEKGAIFCISISKQLSPTP